MIPRIDIDITEPGSYEYRVSYESEPLFEEQGFGSILSALVSAVEGLAPDIRAAEVACAGIVSGTYSSIFNASPLLVVWHEWEDKKRLAADAARPSRRAAT